MKFTNEDYLKGIILFGLNTATYKMVLAQTLLQAALAKKTELSWQELAELYFTLYLQRLEDNPTPRERTGK